MKHRFSLYLVIGLLCCVGCKKEDTKVVEVSMQSFSTSTSAKVYLNEYKPAWHNGDQMCVNGVVYSVNDGSVTVPNMGNMYALYPASDMVSYSSEVYQVELPRVQCYQVDAQGHQHIEALMATCGSGSQLKFANLCSLLKVTAPEGATVLYIDVNTIGQTTPMSGKGTITFTDNTPQFAFGSDNTYPYTRLDCGEGVSRGDRTYYIVVPPFTNKQLTITLCGKINGQKFRHTFTQRNDATLQPSYYAPTPLPAYVYNIEDGLYDGLDMLCEPFSMGQMSQKYFMKGNIQYKASSKSWRMAPNQYSYIGSNNSQISGQYGDFIDLFGWGATGVEGCTEPYESSKRNNGYAINSNMRKNMESAVDWGRKFGDGWVTPTYDQWNFLLTQRGNAANKVAMACIDNQYHGLLILPDYWVLPNGCTFSTSSENQYTLYQWSAMENAGALFLPAAGTRDGTSVASVNSQGYYWSSSRDEQTDTNAYRLRFEINPSRIWTVSNQRHFGCSVRLIK